MDNPKTNYLELIRTVQDYPINGVNFYDLNSLFASSSFKNAMDELITVSYTHLTLPTTSMV